MDVQKDILQGKGGLGRAQRTLPYAKGSYPRFPALSSGRYLPVDAESLFLNGWMSRRTSFKARAVWVGPSVPSRTLKVHTLDIYPSYRQYLWFCHEGVVWQFRALPFGLNTAPRVFTAVTAPVVAYAHLNGVSASTFI